MHRFFVFPTAVRGNQVHFSPEQARQLRSVLRMREGDQVLALDGRGLSHRVELVHLGKKSALGRVLETTPAAGEPASDLILCQAISRSERFEWVLQKGVELGVTIFRPLLTRRTVRRAPGDAKWRRWRRIIQEAAEQSGRGRLPVLEEPLSFTDALAAARGLALLPTVFASAPAGQALDAASWPVTLFVGPEGGFDPREVELARASGVRPVSLGPRILRTETAALVLITLAMNALGELDDPGPRAT
jgi:16S rRNA (uracil1498-N3)-methyltransferase